jgi:hypothetical protein
VATYYKGPRDVQVPPGRVTPRLREDETEDYMCAQDVQITRIVTIW